MISNVAGRARSESHGRLSGGMVITLCVAVAAVVLVVIARALSAGSSLGIGFALILALSPFVLYLGLTRPIALPFGLYAFSIPFSDISAPGLGTLSRGLGILCSIAFLIWMLRTRRIIRPPMATFAWLGLITWMVASLFWALDMDLATPRLWTFVQLFGLFAIASLMAVDRANVRIAALSAALGGLAAAAYAGLLYIRGEQIRADRVIITSGPHQHVDPNHFAAALLLPIALVATAALGASRPLQKIGLFLCVAILFIGLYASGSRGGMVAVAVMLAYLIWRTRYRLQLLLVIATLALMSLGFQMSVWGRLKLDTGRLSIWHTGIKAFEQYWLVGAGIGNFQAAFNRALLIANSHFEGRYRVAHNLIVMIAVELGVVGLVLLVIAIVAQLSMLRGMPPTDPLHNLRTAIEAATLGIFAASMFLGLLEYKYTWLVFILAAFVRAAALPQREASGRRSAVLQPSPAGHNGTVHPWARPTRRIPNSMAAHYHKGWGGRRDLNA